MAGTRTKIRNRKQSGNHARKSICCALAAAAALVLGLFLGLDPSKMTFDTKGSSEPIDFSSLAATVIPLDEFGANGNNPAVVASAVRGLSTTSGMKSNFLQRTSLSGLVSKHAAKLQRHLESGLRTATDTATKNGERTVLTVSWQPSAPLVPEAGIGGPEIAARAGQ
jgi:hypothetical protein